MSRRVRAAPPVETLAPAVLGVFTLSALSALSALTVGCGEQYRDEAFGTLQLDTLVEAGTARTVANRIDPQTGFENTDRAEYYDFGNVPAIVSAEDGAPIAARVPPMYFFFNRAGQPLLARPVREARDGVDHILGGLDVRNPNPKDFCVVGADPAGCAALNAAQLQRNYSTRFRDPLIDPVRGIDDYQRPIVDISPADIAGSSALYTGLWEIVEITVPDDYRPDDVKHWKTMNSAVKAGEFKSRATGKVINCPIVDERTDVPPGITDAATFHPRVEIWYRRKLGWCYLANGWPTLGNAAGELYGANTDAARLDTFDVDRVFVGQGSTVEEVVTVPVRRAWTPNVLNFDEQAGRLETRIAGQIVTAGRPRAKPDDPPGYTPIRWLWDILVFGEYKEDSITDASEIDERQTRPPVPLVVKNLPMRGVARKCSLPEVTTAQDFLGQCGNLATDPVTTAQYVDGSNDPACKEIGLECNPETCSCDVPRVKYGQPCGFGRGRCADPDSNDPFWQDGYTCFPATVGNCYLGCNPFRANEFELQNRGRAPADFVDSRCDSLPGHRCFFVGIGGICLKLCNEDLNRSVGAAQCFTEHEYRVPGEDMSRVENIGLGQMCQNLGVQACAWPDGYTR